MIFKYLSKFIGRRRASLYVSEVPEYSDLSLYEMRRAVHLNHTVRAVHSVISGGAGRVSWRVQNVLGENIEALSALADANMGTAVADWLVAGAAYITDAFRVDAAQYTYDVENPHAPLRAARSLILKLEELERAERQAFWRQGAMAFVTAKSASSGLIPTPAEVEALQKKIDELRRFGGAGGVAVLPVPFETQQLEGLALRDYGFVEQRVMLIRELCNLFRIDSSLLNDPENKTYSNKTEAEKSFFVNVVIPAAYQFAMALNLKLQSNGSEYRLLPDISVLEPVAEERARQAEQLLKLLQAGIITREEARQMLQHAGVLPEFEK